MLDGHENTMEVAASQPRSSPAKQKLAFSQPGSSPSKQKTPDSYMKRCNSREDPENQPKFKNPRH
ncbi:hypothetical protein C1H46_045324 [Malus baccata]|uniref:Uncharacterized protein n=2 Tax=Malus TaxID=3749 RepID=A0A540K5I6_MALBA|nr:hypothetical protein C1H46_045324 [Malus baccata]